MPDQARFGPEFFLTSMPPNFELNIVLTLPANKQRDGPTLFPLLEQCFKEVCLTKWKNVISAYCPDDDAKMSGNLFKCQQDYLEALAGFPDIGDQRIHWFHTAWKPALMLMHNYMHHQVRLCGYLKKGLLQTTMEFDDIPNTKG